MAGTIERMVNGVEVLPLRPAQTRPPSVDEMIARLAAQQHGIVARRQLLARGATRHEIQHRIERARLHPVHRGVYAVGHRALTQRARWMAAVLAGGPGAVLSHRSAGALWKICRSGPRIDVIVAAKRPQRPGTRLRHASLAADETDHRDGIAVTSVARTLLDLAMVLEPQHVERAFHESEYQQLTSPTSLATLMARHPRRPGAGTLRAILRRRARQRTPTEMEADFLAFLDEHGLPRPLTNVARTIHGRRIEADAVYVDQRLIVELDGSSHLTYRRFHSDRARDRSNLVDGWRTIRVTGRHLDDEREELAADMRQLLPARPLR